MRDCLPRLRMTSRGWRSHCQWQTPLVGDVATFHARKLTGLLVGEDGADTLMRRRSRIHYKPDHLSPLVPSLSPSLFSPSLIVIVVEEEDRCMHVPALFNIQWLPRAFSSCIINPSFVSLRESRLSNRPPEVRDNSQWRWAHHIPGNFDTDSLLRNQLLLHLIVSKRKKNKLGEISKLFGFLLSGRLWLLDHQQHHHRHRFINISK